MTMVELKATLRKGFLRRRAAVPPLDRARASLLIRSRVLSLPEVRGADGVFAFISHGTEVHLRPLIDLLDAAGVRIAVPRVVGPGEMIAVEFPGWDDLTEGVLGIPAPASTEPASFPIEVVITPGLGFDSGGGRLGYGGGYYDRWLSRHLAALRVAVAFDIQVVDAIPMGEADQPVDVIATETSVIRTGSRGPTRPSRAAP